MTTTTRNEAAERLREQLLAIGWTPLGVATLDQALAAERRATVERIRERLNFEVVDEFGPVANVRESILDEEAAR